MGQVQGIRVEGPGHLAMAKLVEQVLEGSIVNQILAPKAPGPPRMLRPCSGILLTFPPLAPGEATWDAPPLEKNQGDGGEPPRTSIQGLEATGQTLIGQLEGECCYPPLRG